MRTGQKSPTACARQCDHGRHGRLVEKAVQSCRVRYERDHFGMVSRLRPFAAQVWFSEALRYDGRSQFFWNPDRGFVCFADRRISDVATATGTLQTMADAARRLSDSHA